MGNIFINIFSIFTGPGSYCLRYRSLGGVLSVYPFSSLTRVYRSSPKIFGAPYGSWNRILCLEGRNVSLYTKGAYTLNHYRRFFIHVGLSTNRRARNCINERRWYWRRMQDSNLRTGVTQPNRLANDPLITTWVILHLLLLFGKHTL